ncbi:MAG: type II secretion system protein GspD [Candidatus Hydrogenedens sp.]|nr:type II secretion system protein GspD [Candidatus Hydrogenedens sp.]
MATDRNLIRWAAALCVLLAAHAAYPQGPEGEFVEGEFVQDNGMPVEDALPVEETYEGDPNAADPNMGAAPEGIAEGEQAINDAPLMPANPQPIARPVRRPITRRPPPGDNGFAPPPPAPRASVGDTGASSKPKNTGPKNGDVAAEAVDFDFEGAQIKEVIESISRLTGRNFEFDPNLGASQVTVITHDKIPPEMAYEVLEAILAARQFSMVETLDGNLIRILPTPQAASDPKVPLYVGGDHGVEGYDGFSTHIVPVKYASPEEISQVMKSLGSPSAVINTYLPTNTLIITDTADGIRRMLRFLELADVPGSDVEMDIFTLEYTRAEVLATQLEQVLTEEGGGGAPGATPGQVRQPVRTTRRPTTRPIPGQVESQVIGSNSEVFRSVADERLNALIVLATPGMMERVRDLITRLDSPTPYESNNLHVYQLLNADAESVETALQPLISTAPRRAGGAAGGGAAAGGGGGGAAGGAEVQPFEQQVQITRYDETNSLLIVASPQDYKVLEAFVARLDVPQRQVNVLATVMNVSITDNYGVVVDAAGLQGNDGFGLTSTSNLLQVASAANGIATGQDGSLDIPTTGANIALSLLSLGTGGGLTAGIFDDIDVDLPDGTTVQIPFVPLLFQAIETMTDLEVLSLPSITTVDNEEASVTVGQEVPFVTNQRRATDTDTNNNNNNFNFNNFNSIRREDVGVKLTVTPQISEGDNVRMELNLEISEIAANQIGDVNLLGPTTNKSLIENTVTVKDGSTAVLAGLIRETSNRNRTQAPVLGDVPVLGWLFRSRGADRRKENLVALVTPHIIKDHVDMERVTHFHVDEYQKANIEEFLDRGFFQKVKKRADDRKRYRPTQAEAEKVIGRSTVDKNFGRGDIDR